MPVESFEKTLELLQTSHSIKYNIISNPTCMCNPKHSLIPKVSASYIKNIKYSSLLQ